MKRFNQAFLCVATLLMGLTAVFSSLNAQTSSHTPDKVYLQLDRNLYAQGDTIWIKGYVIERGSNVPSDKSYAIHVQMLNDEGQEVGYHKLLCVNGEATGQIELFYLMKPGFYQLVAHTGYMKNFDKRFFFRTTIEIRQRKMHRSVQTVFDKTSYQPGDTAALNFTVNDERQKPVGGARFVYEYVVGGKVLKKDGVQCYDDGTMQVKLPLLQDSLQNEKALLRVSYLATDGARHRTVQEIPIPVNDFSMNISFFPEGGDLVKGIPAKVAFKAYDNKGNPLSIKGEWLKDDRVMGEIHTVHDGMGLLSLTPGEADYAFRVTEPVMSDALFALPAIKPEGFSLSYTGQDDDVVNFKLSHNYDQTQGCKIWISYCDSLLGTKGLQVDSALAVSISKEDLPGGIVTFTLSDGQDVPQAERLVYVEQEYPAMAITTNKTRYSKRELVTMDITLDEPNVSRLSYAVVDSVLGLSLRASRSGIRAYAELTSELQGFIPNADQYLGSDRNTIIKRDLMLMTHGWRRFEWMARRDSLSHLPIRDYNRVDGAVSRFGKPYKKSEIIVLDLGNVESNTRFKTDKNGRFFFTPEYQVRRDKNLMVVANAPKVNFLLQLDLQNTDTVRTADVLSCGAVHLAPMPMSELHDDTTYQKPFMLYDVYQLQEVEVSADTRTWDMERYINYAEDVILGTELYDADQFEDFLSQASNRLLLESEVANQALADNLFDRAIVKTNPMDRPDIMANGESYLSIELSTIFNDANPPAAMIYLNEDTIGYLLSELNFLTKGDIAAIAVLDGAKGHERFGIEAYYGAIMVYTYSKDILKKRNIAMNKALFGNFIKARRFPEQLYEAVEGNEALGDDRRVTLHWQPFIFTDLDGRATSSFFTSDIPGKKEIIVQGFDDDGNLYYGKTSFDVKEER